MRRIGILLVAAAVPLVAAAGALASGGSVMKAYGGAGNYPTKVSATATQAGTLPFTGLDLGVGIAVAAGLVVLGFVLRRAGRRSES